MGLFDFFRSRSSSLRGRKSSAAAAAADIPAPPPASAAPAMHSTQPPAAPTSTVQVPAPPASAPAALEHLYHHSSSTNNRFSDDSDSDSDDSDNNNNLSHERPSQSLGNIQNYEIVQELGRGATAVVQLGRHRDNFAHLVALKVFQTSLLKKMREVKRVGRRMIVSTAFDKVQVEIAIMKKLAHVHLLNLLEVFDDDAETLVLMLEYAPHGQVMHWNAATRTYSRKKSGSSSSSSTDAPVVLSEAEARICMRELLLGLEYLHENNICHRDLKPENILVGADGVHKIADFGVAQLFDVTNATERVADKKGYVSSTAGTYAFMAPETLKGGSFDAYAADMWALGITLHALALGRIPFYDPDVVALFEQIEHAPIVLPTIDTEAAPVACDNALDAPIRISSSFASFLTGLLTKDPDARLSLKQAKAHPWILEGLDEQAKRAFVDVHHDVVTVDSNDVMNAVTKVSSFNVLLRVKLGANRWLKKAQKSSDERKRASLTADDVSSRRSLLGSSIDEEAIDDRNEVTPEAIEIELKAPAGTTAQRELADNQAEI